MGTRLRRYYYDPQLAIRTVALLTPQFPACGACVVTTLAGGVPHIPQDGLNCLSAPVGDAARLAASIGELLTRPELAARVSRQARAGVEACDWPAVAARWRSLLSSAAKRSSYPKKGIYT